MYLDKCYKFYYLTILIILKLGGAANVLSAFNAITEMQLPVFIFFFIY